MRNGPDQLGAAVLAALPAAVVVVDGAGAVLLRNPAADKLLPAGETLAELLPCRDGEGERIAWDEPLARLGAAPQYYDALRLEGASGGVHRVDVHLRRLDGANSAAVAVVQDVSERESMHRRLATAERMAAVGTLAAKVAHELNNPLDGVLRYVGLAERACGAGEADKTAGYLDRIRAAVGRMGDVVSGLLSYSRLSGRPTEMAALRPLIEQALDAMAPHIEAAGVTVVCDLDDDGRAVSGDLFGVLCNLIKNAADAMAAGGRLTIACRVGAQAVVTVADTGPGLDPATMEQIFQPFFTTKTGGKGTGLGLSICRETLRRAGGDVTAANGPDGGAVFTLTLPPTQPRRRGRP